MSLPHRLHQRGAIEPLEQRIAPAVFVVTNAGDAGTGSLRDAIDLANATPGGDTIQFEIAGAGLQILDLRSQLPAITDKVLIDGFTQPGAAANRLDEGNNAVVLIRIDGSNAGNTDGLVLARGSDGSTIRGLMLTFFRQDGSGGDAIEIYSNSNTIEGNFIGNDGTEGLRNDAAGIHVVSGDGNIIGGTTPAARNVISGNFAGIALREGSSATVVANNYIGTNASGTSTIGNITGIEIDHSS